MVTTTPEWISPTGLECWQVPPTSSDLPVANLPLSSSSRPWRRYCTHCDPVSYRHLFTLWVLVHTVTVSNSRKPSRTSSDMHLLLFRSDETRNKHVTDRSTLPGECLFTLTLVYQQTPRIRSYTASAKTQRHIKSSARIATRLRPRCLSLTEPTHLANTFQQ